MTALLIWVIGAVLFYMADGYFKFPFRIPSTNLTPSFNLIFLAAPFWPITIWFVLASKLRKVAEKARETKEQKMRVRVAEIKEAADLLQIGEEEAEKVLESASRKTL